MSYFDNLMNDIQAAAQKPQPKQSATFDGVVHDATDDESAYTLTQARIEAAAAVNTWTETAEEDLEDGETLADRLDALLIGTLDADKDGEITDEEADALAIVFDAAAEYLLHQGVSEDDTAALLSDGDADAAERVQELLINIAPDGEDAEYDSVNDFAFNKEQQVDGTFDAVYKRKMAVRNGKKTIIRKRVAGRVKLTAKQKMAVKKMLRKSHSGKAKMRRAKSMRRRAALNM